MSAQPDSLPQDSHDGTAINPTPIMESPRTLQVRASTSKLHTAIRSSKRPQTSMIWMHHKPSPDGLPLIDKDGDICWSCLYCTKTYKYKSGTRKAIEHIQRSHGIDGTNTNHMRKHATQTLSPETNSSVDINTLKELYLKWITSDLSALKQAQSPEFRAFLEYISPYASALEALDISQTTISTVPDNEH